MRALSPAGVERLQSSSVAIIGCGGIGSVVVEQLARLGVDRLVLVDDDTVEQTNLPRLVGATFDDMERPKAEVLAEHVASVRRGVDTEAVVSRVEDSLGAWQDTHLVVAGVDTMEARLNLNNFAVKTEMPYLDAGSIIHSGDGRLEAMRGYVQMVTAESGCLDCIDRIDIDRVQLERMDEEAVRQQIREGYVDEEYLEPEPAVIQLNGVVASIAVNQVVKYVTGVDRSGCFIRYDGLGEDLHRVSVPVSDECPTCTEFREC